MFTTKENKKKVSQDSIILQHLKKGKTISTSMRKNYQNVVNFSRNSLERCQHKQRVLHSLFVFHLLYVAYVKISKICQFLDFYACSLEAFKLFGIVDLQSVIRNIRKTTTVKDKWIKAINQNGEHIRYKQYFIGETANG